MLQLGLVICIVAYKFTVDVDHAWNISGHAHTESLAYQGISHACMVRNIRLPVALE